MVLVFIILVENYDALNKASSFRFHLYSSLGWYTSPIPVWLIILIALTCGYAIASISGFLQKMSYKKRIKQLESELESAATPVEPARKTSDQTHVSTSKEP